MLKIKVAEGWNPEYFTDTEIDVLERLLLSCGVYSGTVSNARVGSGNACFNVGVISVVLSACTHNGQRRYDVSVETPYNGFLKDFELSFEDVPMRHDHILRKGVKKVIDIAQQANSLYTLVDGFNIV